MSEHRVTIGWERTTEEFDYETYNRDHTWTFEDGRQIAASATPAYKGNPDRVDPEAAFVASLSACHMLTFLAVAAHRGIVVDKYEDQAVGYLEKNDKGKLAVTRVELHPAIVFGGDEPDAAALEQMHDKAHRECFIANSVLTEVSVEPALSPA